MKKLLILTLLSALTLTGCSSGQYMTGDGHVRNTSSVPYEVDKTGNHDAGTYQQQQQEATFNSRLVD
jgi:hypothetical protein